MKALIKAYSYVRVSGKGQVEGDGFRRQEAEIQAFAQAHGFEVVEVYREEGVSGTAGEADRPAFQAMVEAILQKRLNHLSVEGVLAPFHPTRQVNVHCWHRQGERMPQARLQPG